ncbi:MAG: prolipoprotein diacylglyceryl transferase [Omnitrophica bacterium RIFCSPHIGHO2_02_FULL_46_11]|nr:MAG: prolipoprotein diacylglyceryl transferase [Omnitrophica bacterium RIFCSPHIGHO2_02_FULL_46_11]OGW85923.1 MAG: prolipoprotein diacylglyceryl transferase [Omnitrophica bacterium RIFCSPLOWO2_01_FULL_45_10b]
MHPILVSLGPVHLYSFGILVAVGVLCAVMLLRANAKQISINPDLIVDLAIVVVLSGFTGARIFYIIQFWDYFRSSPLDVFKIWEGGIVLYGGLVGGLTGFIIFTKVKQLPFLSVLDSFVPALALAQGFGRIGCFLNGCCYGKETHWPWAVSFPFLKYPVHPTQIYESVFNFSLAAFLLFLFYRRYKSGTVVAAYFILYPAGRFIFEFFRGDNLVVFLNLTLYQWISLAFIGITLVLFLRGRSSHHGNKAAHRPT